MAAGSTGERDPGYPEESAAAPFEIAIENAACSIFHFGLLFFIIEQTKDSISFIFAQLRGSSRYGVPGEMCQAHVGR